MERRNPQWLRNATLVDLAAIDLGNTAPPVSHLVGTEQGTAMRFAIATLFTAATLLAAACSSGEAAPGSPDWCKNTPQDKQTEDPTAMMKCLDQAAS